MTTPDKFLLAGVMGWPVMHSRSPLIHGYWIKKHGLNADYRREEVAPENFRAFIGNLPAQGYVGANITIPHKEAALEIVDEIGPTARKMGAISCVTVDKDGKKIPFSVKVGDKVLVGKYAGTEVKLNDETYLLLREEEILAVVE